MNRDPSGEIESTVDWPVTMRLRRMDAEAVSYTNNTVDALLLMVLSPMMNAPSWVRSSFPRNVVCGRGSTTGETGAGVGGGGAKATGVNCWLWVCEGSNISSELIWSVLLVPSVVIRTRPSLPTATPSGFAVKSTVCVTVFERKSMEEERRAALRPKLVENFAALHLLDAGGPDECHAFLEHSGAAAGFFNLYDVPGYFAYLMAQADLAAAYRAHKRQLQLLQWRLPKQSWALKYPNYIIAMDAILDVYPDARFAVTHRDPLQILAVLRSEIYEQLFSATAPPAVGRERGIREVILSSWLYHG